MAPKSKKGNKDKGKPKEDENIASQSRPKPKSKEVGIVCSDQVTSNVGQMYALESSGCSKSKKGNKVKGKPEEDENIASMSRPKPKSKKVEIVCSDRVSLHVGELYAVESCVVDNCITYEFVSPIRLDFPSQIVSIVIDFCKKHTETRNTNEKDAHEKLKDFNSEFLKDNQSILIDLLHVALELQIKSLLDLTREAVVDMINGKTAEEIHKILNMEEDFNADDLETLLELDDWGFE